MFNDNHVLQDTLVTKTNIADGLTVLKAALIETPIGRMCIVTDNQSLHMLALVDQPGFTKQIIKLKSSQKASVVQGQTKPITMIKQELRLYFSGLLQQFKTPIRMLGSNFQKSVWQALMTVPYGTTRSYLEQANIVGNGKACRAVANANGANKLAIIIPCHRIINSNGGLGGYGGGVIPIKKINISKKPKSENKAL